MVYDEDQEELDQFSPAREVVDEAEDEDEDPAGPSVPETEEEGYE